ncbi:methyl-accepting chemotaxis protein [Marispirochaeta sp.]|uniref:methyl-accepting chemotaxis protein n=1 Tax=Marispirochaeta sp. TaxID=2038653 RepID=UPI0029C96EB4|nr:methyl-accepting chemotaxis protein [Marispirochaeta sp.]
MTGLLAILRRQTGTIDEVAGADVKCADCRNIEPGEIIAFFHRLSGGRLDLTFELPGINPVAQAVNGHVSSLESFFSSLMENLVQVSGSGKYLEERVGSLSRQADTQTVSVREITLETNRLNGEIHSLAERVSGFAGLTHDSFNAASEGYSLNGEFQMRLENLKAGMVRTVGAMNKLTGLLDSVLSLTEIIDESAEALHLISINTAIEAARAGDRGFGVIATELRALARRAGETVREVDRIVNSVHEEIKAVDEAIEDSASVMDVLISDSERVGEAFSGINEFARKVEEEGSSISNEILKQREGLGSVATRVQAISRASEEIQGEAENTGAVATQLKSIVGTILEKTGSLRLRRHKRAVELLQECLKGVSRLPGTDREHLDRYLEEWICKHDQVELVYAMDSRGRQVSSNIVSGKHKGSVREQGFGEDRSRKEYFSSLQNSNKVYVSDIYLSDASSRLCITVSGSTIDLEGDRLCIALDLNLEGLVRV